MNVLFKHNFNAITWKYRCDSTKSLYIIFRSNIPYFSIRVLDHQSKKRPADTTWHNFHSTLMRKSTLMIDLTAHQNRRHMAGDIITNMVLRIYFVWQRTASFANQQLAHCTVFWQRTASFAHQQLARCTVFWQRTASFAHQQSAHCTVRTVKVWPYQSSVAQV